MFLDDGNNIITVIRARVFDTTVGTYEEYDIDFDATSMTRLDSAGVATVENAVRLK